MSAKKRLLIFLIFFAFWIFVFEHASAQSLQNIDYGTSTPKDTDQDGLTDQAEINIYKTDPNNPDTDGDGYLDGAEIILKSNPLDKNDPKTFLVPFGSQNGQNVENTTNTVSIPDNNIKITVSAENAPWAWYISRAMGILSYILAFIVFAFGIGVYTKNIYWIIRSENAIEIHKYLSISLWVVLTIHIFSLLFDNYIKLTVIQLLVPFQAQHKPFDISLGIFAFYAFLAIIISSLYFRMRHKKMWRKLHYLTYVFFWLGLFHGVAIGSDTNTTYMQYIYWITGVLGVLLVLYRLWFSYSLNKRGHPFFVSNIRNTSGGVSMLELRPAYGEVFDFKPGQYAMLALPESDGKLSVKRPFSIASSAHQKDKIEFGIKTQGEFTQKISKIRPDQEVFVFGPFGDFVFDGAKAKNMVFFAGGIGITPFMNMIRYATEGKLKNNLTLIYSNRTVDGTEFKDEILELADQNERFNPYFFITDEKVQEGGNLINGRITEEGVLSIIPDPENTIFFICGPDKFITFIFNMLLDFGVTQENIRKELFF